MSPIPPWWGWQRRKPSPTHIERNKKGDLSGRRFSFLILPTVGLHELPRAPHARQCRPGIVRACADHAGDLRRPQRAAGLIEAGEDGCPWPAEDGAGWHLKTSLVGLSGASPMPP